MPKKITLIVDEKWLEAIMKFTEEVYDGELCTWTEVADY